MKRVLLPALAICAMVGVCRAASTDSPTPAAAMSPAKEAAASTPKGDGFGLFKRHRKDMAATSNPTPDPYPMPHKHRHKKAEASPSPGGSPEVSPTPGNTAVETPTPAPAATATPAAVASPTAEGSATPKRSKRWLRRHHVKVAASPGASPKDLGPLPSGTAAPGSEKKPDTGAEGGGSPAANGNALLGAPNSFIPSATEAATPSSLADQDAAERARFNDVKAKALEDDKVMALKEKMDTAATADDQASASKVFYKALYSKMRELDPSLKDRIDRMQALTTKRLEQGQ